MIATSLILTAAALAGFLIGHKTSQRVTDRSQIGAIQASILGLLALLLGFTFGVASSRYDVRRVLAVDEANALGTTFMRAQMLPEPYRTSISDMLRHYIDLRIQTASVLGNPSKTRKIMKETEELQQAIWKQATAVARKDSSVITGLFVSSLNESIDLYSSRVAVFLTRVPSTILWILACIAIVALAVVGYGFGLIGQRSWLAIALMPVVIAAVIVMIVDLDRPEAGPTRVSQQSMIDLRNSLSGFESRGR
jgi:hypothetical protein